tara:strand:- start:131 stop:1393 length:1263 start_codon:yes stop_codon:yes gene_type:complete
VNTNKQLATSATRIASSNHQIDESKICPRARAIVEKLTAANYQAYLVGGCVRDLMLNITPKDFDVVTDARPEQICKLFSNSRMIGRRFRLVHVYSNRNFIEVSTFRAVADASKQRHTEEANNGRILRDNTYGNIEQDAIRRDFTINALYYDLASSEVLDFCNGIDDLRNGQIRIIGDAYTRYKEDPVRMLRALRFKAKLGLQIEPETAQPITALGSLLRDIPAARMFDETVKLFHSGSSVKCFNALRDYDLLHILFPYTAQSITQDEQFLQLIYAALANTDRRILTGKSVNPAFIFAILLWKPYCELLESAQSERVPISETVWQAARTTVVDQSTLTFIPKRLSIVICEIWRLQHRFHKRKGRKPLQILMHPRFRAAYDFFCLRTEAGEVDPAECTWWTNIQHANEEEKMEMVNTRQQHK